GATLQFIVLKWDEQVLGLDLSRAAILQAIVAIGIAVGAIYAAASVSLRRSLGVLPVGVAMGVIVVLASFYSRALAPAGELLFASVSVSWFLLIAGAFLILIGALAGYFVVPMNALLQHRGHVLLSAGHSIAVQNFNENVSILMMLALYSLMIRVNLPIDSIIVIFGLFVAATMYMVIRWNAANHRA